MPTCHIQTNVKTAPKDLHDKITGLLAEVLKKDKKYICTIFDFGKDMRFSGSDAPCAIVNLSSIRSMSAAANPGYSAKISALLKKELGIPDDRCYINFINPDWDDVGYQGTTFGVLVK